MLGVAATVNALPALFTPPARTTTLPVVAPAGTVATMLLAPQLVIVAVTPLNLTSPAPCVEPKFEPAIVIAAPIAPVDGVRLAIAGVPTTVNALPLLLTLLTRTTTFPVVAPVGTATAIELALHVVTLAVVPLNVTVLEP